MKSNDMLLGLCFELRLASLAMLAAVVLHQIMLAVTACHQIYNPRRHREFARHMINAVPTHIVPGVAYLTGMGAVDFWR
jgi:hypothetical protein